MRIGSAMRLNIALALATLVVGLSIVAAGDRTSWSQGYGWDGRTYGDIAEHFPGAVLDDDPVVPPGYGPYTGPKLVGIDAYYVRRILPSGVVYYTLSALSIEKTPENVIACFGVWNAVIIALAAFLWCLAADRLGFGRSAKLFGLTALLVNFAILKSVFYFPVSTDTFAFGFGAATLYFWITRKTVGLVATTFLGAFAWPTQLLLGSLLLLFPPGELPLAGRRKSLDETRRSATVGRSLVAGLPALALLTFLVIKRIEDYGAPAGIPLGGAFPLAVAVAALFVFFALVWLVPDLNRRQFKNIAESLLSRRALVVAALVASVLVAQSALTDRASIIDQGGLLQVSLWYSALNPGLFAVAIVGFFGPLLVLAALFWPHICRQFHSFGPGATLVAALFIGTCLLTESRKLIVLYPFFVLFAVLGTGQVAARRWFLPVFVAISVLMSRIWLPIGEFELSEPLSIIQFPAQRYFMSTGIWTSFDMYLVQLAAVCLLAGLFLVLRMGTAGAGAARVAATTQSSPT